MDYRYFSIDDFKCPCCNQNRINHTFILLLDEARHRAGIPFRVNSGYRCIQHNLKVGGSATSSHIKGVAVDIACTDSVSRLKIISALLSVGVNRIGIAKTFIHCDIDRSKTSCIYIY